jgi:hypothetical protein
VLPWPAQKHVKELDSLFVRARRQQDLEVQSDYAKYLVIRVSGLVEQVVSEIVLDYTQKRAQPPIVDHVAWRMNMFQNPTVDRILDMVASFQSAWRVQLEGELTTPEREAMGTINKQRNRIAHGEESTISLGQVNQYYAEIKTLLERVATLLT